MSPGEWMSSNICFALSKRLYPTIHWSIITFGMHWWYFFICSDPDVARSSCTASIFRLRFLLSQCLFHLRFVTKAGVGYGVDEMQKAVILSASSCSCWNGVLVISSKLDGWTIGSRVPVDIDSYWLQILSIPPGNHWPARWRMTARAGCGWLPRWAPAAWPWSSSSPCPTASAPSWWPSRATWTSSSRR